MNEMCSVWEVNLCNFWFQEQEHLNHLALLTHKQICSSNWDCARRIVLYAAWILVIFGFYSLWDRDETCYKLTEEDAASDNI